MSIFIETEPTPKQTDPPVPTAPPVPTDPPGNYNLFSNLIFLEREVLKKLHIKRNRIVNETTEPERFEAYSLFAKDLHQSINFMKDPCDDFYAYTCGRYNKPISFSVVQEENIEILLNAINKPNVGL